MKEIKTDNFKKLASDKEYNPWAVCNKSTGGKKEDPDKFERCVQHVKEQNRESEIDETKDAVRPTKYYRNDKITDEDFSRKIRDEMSGKADEDRRRSLDNIWLDAIEKVKSDENKKKRTSFAGIIEPKK
jgi:hypothetical protein